MTNGKCGLTHFKRAGVHSASLAMKLMWLMLCFRGETLWVTCVDGADWAVAATKGYRSRGMQDLVSEPINGRDRRSLGKVSYVGRIVTTSAVTIHGYDRTNDAKKCYYYESGAT